MLTAWCQSGMWGIGLAVLLCGTYILSICVSWLIWEYLRFLDDYEKRGPNWYLHFINTRIFGSTYRAERYTCHYKSKSGDAHDGVTNVLCIGAVLFLAPLGAHLAFAFPYWAGTLALFVLVTWGMRYGRRTYKKLKKHVADKNLHMYMNEDV